MFANLTQFLTKIWLLQMEVAFVIIISYDDNENGGMAGKDSRKRQHLPG